MSFPFHAGGVGIFWHVVVFGVVQDEPPLQLQRGGLLGQQQECVDGHELPTVPQLPESLFIFWLGDQVVLQQRC